jgi:phosphoglycolate phosphatase-like HAD superfamily hydrolase
MRVLKEYCSLVFDCDGVVLNSNHVKTEAFYQAALPYGEAAAQALVDYHVANGGISRYRKFEYLLGQILGLPKNSEALDALLAHYAALVHDGLRSCAVAPGLQALRAQLPDANWLIVSGGDQEELREVFAVRGLAALFDGGIYGSPDAKDMILARELERGNIRMPALFLGDSRFDHQCATAAGIDFVFLSSWSEFKGWPEYFSANPVVVRESLGTLMAE